MFLKKENITKLFFTTDIHGSEKCWKKLLNAGSFYDVPNIILGGDISGKGIQIIVEDTPGVWVTNLFGKLITVEGISGLHDLENRIRSIGFYPFCATHDTADALYASNEKQQELFQQLATQSIERWLEMAESKLKGTGVHIFVVPGNDDPLFIDRLFEGSTVCTWAQRQIIRIDDTHEMINEGYVNPTPWDTYREMNEDELLRVLEEQIAQLENPYYAIFNLHAPPYNSNLDDAPLLDDELIPKDSGHTLVPVGSKAVRQVIETYQPIVGLHGHVHESRAASYIGRTLCINPGSMCTEGNLSGYIITINKRGLRSYQPVLG